MERKCIYCGCDISHKRKDAVICDNSECKRKQYNDRYNAKLYDKVCPVCGKHFQGVKHKINCDECERIRTVINYSQKTTQYIHCKHCGKILETKLKNVTKPITEHLYTGCCEECKQKNYKNLSLRMKLNNPAHNKTASQKHNIKKEYNKYIAWFNKQDNKRKESIKKALYLKMKLHNPMKKKENMQKASLRMKLHNPMKNKETVQKMILTKQQNRLKNKDKPFKHKSTWKGIRSFHQHVRIELRYWHKQRMEEAGYKCQICGKMHEELNVHHTEPLRDIINRILKQHNISSKEEIDINSDLCNQLVKEIKEYHDNHPEIGMVVCTECHSKIDKHYKPRKSKKYKPFYEKLKNKITLS